MDWEYPGAAGTAAYMSRSSCRTAPDRSLAPFSPAAPSDMLGRFPIGRANGSVVEHVSNVLGVNKTRRIRHVENVPHDQAVREALELDALGAPAAPDRNRIGR